jgi:predicted PurR-regulated permease PerM
MIPEEIRQNPWVQAVVGVGISLGVLWFLSLIWDIILLFLLAFFLAYILDPAVDWMENGLGVQRLYAIVILLTIIVIFMTGLGYYLTQQALLIGHEIGTILKNPPDIQAWAQYLLPEPLYTSVEASLENFKTQKLYERGLSYVRTHLSSVTNTLTQGSTVLLGFARQTLGALGIFINSMVFIFATIYFLWDFDSVIHNLRTLIPLRYRPSTDELFGEIDELLRAFFRGHLIVSVTIGILYGTGYLLVGLRGGFLIGFLSGLMNFIPYVGPSIGFLLAFGLGLYQFNTFSSILGIIIVFVLVQSLEGNILTPNIVGGAVGLNPVTVIFSLLVFGKFLGFIGLLVAIPMAGIFKVLLTRLVRYYRSTDYYRKPPS